MDSTWLDHVMLLYYFSIICVYTLSGGAPGTASPLELHFHKLLARASYGKQTVARRGAGKLLDSTPGEDEFRDDICCYGASLRLGFFRNLPCALVPVMIEPYERITKSLSHFNSLFSCRRESETSRYQHDCFAVSLPRN